jgi:ATP-binding cassette subfamily B multidrug efflux pump
VGRSGAGKSTLFKLLLRFYDSESGQILIDGQDIAAVTQDSLRAQIGMVQQDSSLLHRSLRDNIRYGRNSASEAEISAAAAQAQADEFHRRSARTLKGAAAMMPALASAGVKLSGGQRQRIALARVILKDAPILLLDEATSALDSEVEAGDPRHALRHDGGQNRDRHCPPAVHHCPYGPYFSNGRGPHCRRWQP